MAVTTLSAARLWARLLPWLGSPQLFPAISLVLALMAFGLLAPWLGYYWDDWPKAWFLHVLGPLGFGEVYALDRPYLAWTYYLTTAVLGEHPLAWQGFAVLAAWAAAVAMWWLIRETWPGREDMAIAAGLLALVYPGFSQHPIALIYSHYFLILAVHLGSLALMVRALRQPRRRSVLTLASALTALYSLFSIEYFIGLELLRPVLIWHVASRDRSPLGHVARAWAPYLPGLLAYLGWRVFLLGFPTYQPGTLQQAVRSPATTVPGLLLQIALDVVEAGFLAWRRAFALPSPDAFGRFSTAAFILVVLGSASLLTLWLATALPRADRWPETRPTHGDRSWGALVVTGSLGLLVAGWPYWVTGLSVLLAFPKDRFFLSFLPGAAMLMAGLSGWAIRDTRLRAAFLIALTALATGYHFRQQVAYRRSWQQQRRLLWQMVWRIPHLREGTLVLTHDLPISFFDDESLSAAINWLYGPGDLPGRRMPYMAYYLSVRLGRALPALEPGLPIREGFRATYFEGSTSAALVITYQPPKCLRVLDVMLDDSIPGFPPRVPEAIPLSDLSRIVTAAHPDRALPEHLLGPEPPHGWCYYFQKADLARQRGDWQEIVRLWKEARLLDDRPNDASERFPFIEGLAHMGDWEQALELSRAVIVDQPPMEPAVCRLWSRLLRETRPSPSRRQAADTLSEELSCQWAGG